MILSLSWRICIAISRACSTHAGPPPPGQGIHDRGRVVSVVDITEDDKAYAIVELPEVTKEDVHVSVENGVSPSPANGSSRRREGPEVSSSNGPTAPCPSFAARKHYRGKVGATCRTVF